MEQNNTRDIQALLKKQVVPEGGTRHGVVVGVERYADKRLNLRCAAADARAVYDLMVDPDCGCFPRGNVRLLLDDEATHDSVWRALARLRRNAAPGDVVWIYFAGHAAPEGGNVYWALHDADVDDLFATGLDNDRIGRVLEEIRARRLVMMLDCCHAAATAIQRNPTRAALTADDVFAACKGEGRVTFSSSDGAEKSVELGDVGHGAFTYFLTQGLRGEADRDGDGVVTAEELWEYLRDRVTDASTRVGNVQRPRLIGELTHGFPLTLNPAGVGRLKRLAEAVLAAVKYGPDHLDDVEADYCIDILRRGAHTPVEKQLVDDMGDLADGALSDERFKRLVIAARTAEAMPPVEEPGAAAEPPRHQPPSSETDTHRHDPEPPEPANAPRPGKAAPPPPILTSPPPLPNTLGPKDPTSAKVPAPPPSPTHRPDGSTACAPPAVQRPVIVVSAKSRLVACLLGLFLGAFGVHNFYLDRPVRGVIQLVLGLTGFGILISYPWALVEVIGIALYITPVNRSRTGQLGAHPSTGSGVPTVVVILVVLAIALMAFMVFAKGLARTPL